MSSSTLTSKKWLLLYSLALLGAVLFGWVYANRFEPETRFWAEVFEKRREELSERSAAPHVFFTGDSACTFSISPKAFEAETGQLAWNLGGTCQMGVSTFMTETLSQAREGDSIVLICNPEMLTRGFEVTKAGVQMAMVAELDLPLSSAECIDATRPGFSHLVTHASLVALGRPSFVYQMTGYREGGLVTTPERPQLAPEVKKFQVTASEVAEVLNHWASRCREKKVHLLYLLPMQLTALNMVKENRERRSEFMADLANLIDGRSITLLPTPYEATSADSSLFSDTLYHLTEEAAFRYTKEIASSFQR